MIVPQPIQADMKQNIKAPLIIPLDSPKGQVMQKSLLFYDVIIYRSCLCSHPSLTFILYQAFAAEAGIGSINSFC